MISIVIPTYNEAGNIAKLIEEISTLWIPAYAGMTKRVIGQYEIIVVDDDSPDGTSEMIARKNSRIHLLSHPQPRDLGRSILMGVEAARGDVIIGMDGDGNHDPRYIPRLLDALQNADLVVGSRFINQKIPNLKHQIPNKFKVSKSKIQNIGSFVFNVFLKFYFGFPIWDNTSGFYAIRRKTLQSLNPPSIYYGYGEYHLRLVYKAMQRRLRIVEVPVIYPPRLHGQSKSRLFIMLRTYLWTAFRLTSQY